jgi:hypothetical protein
MSAQIPDILVERYRLKELPQEAADRLAGQARQDATLRDRIEALDRSDEEMRRTGALDRLANRIVRETRSGARGRRRPVASWAVPAAAAAAIVALVVAARSPALRLADRDAVTATAPSGDRIKGLRPSLAVYRRTADGSETLADGAVARPGEVLRVGYHAAGRPFGIIFSVDGRGTITMHLPAGGDHAVPLAREATTLLDQAYELDDAPLWERFYFVTGDRAFTAAPVVDAARRAAGDPRPAVSLALPRGLEQSIFTLEKEVRP